MLYQALRSMLLGSENEDNLLLSTLTLWALVALGPYLSCSEPLHRE